MRSPRRIARGARSSYAVGMNGSRPCGAKGLPRRDYGNRQSASVATKFRCHMRLLAPWPYCCLSLGVRTGGTRSPKAQTPLRESSQMKQTPSIRNTNPATAPPILSSRGVVPSRHGHSVPGFIGTTTRPQGGIRWAGAARVAGLQLGRRVRSSRFELHDDQASRSEWRAVMRHRRAIVEARSQGKQIMVRADADNTHSLQIAEHQHRQ